MEEAGQSDEDAVKFLENMTEMLAMATSEGKQVPPEVSDTLDQILSGLSDNPQASTSSLADGLGHDSSPPPVPAGDGFLEFFDFTLYNEDEHGSKANTPDLVQASSTNPSPGSGSELDGGHGSSSLPDTAHIADPKGDDELDGSDHLRLSIWKEIDGGEAAYYNADSWKWEGTMPTLEQPWAIADR